jgi:hypothetical protein
VVIHVLYVALYRSVVDMCPEWDYRFYGFAHNVFQSAAPKCLDCDSACIGPRGWANGPGKGADRETDPETTFRENMTRYVEEARAAGAQPVLVTSIVRRVFTDDGKIKRDSLVPYVEVVRELAMELKVPLVDLYVSTLAQAEKLGSDGCAEIDAGLPDRKRDTTHLGPKGSEEIAGWPRRNL